VPASIHAGSRDHMADYTGRPFAFAGYIARLAFRFTAYALIAFGGAITFWPGGVLSRPLGPVTLLELGSLTVAILAGSLAACWR
jgi:hypothetical protein